MLFPIGRWAGSRARQRGCSCSWPSASLLLLACAIAAPARAQDDSLEQLPADGSSVEPPPADGAAPDDATQPPLDEDLSAPASEEPLEDTSGAVADYALRLQELEDRVNDLKEEIFRAKSRLVLLRERVLGTGVGGSQAIISHVNDMSATFDLVQVVYSLDGHEILSLLDDEGSLADQDRFEVYNGAIAAGPHNLSVEMYFVGNGFGVFSYLEGYRFRVRSSHAFNAEDARVAHLDVIAYEQGGINEPIEERPDIRYELELSDAGTAEDTAEE